MGNERAALAARGLELAPRGSLRDDTLREVLRRERRERFAEVELFARLIGLGLKVPQGIVLRLIDAYFLEASQERYRPEYHARKRGVYVRQSANDRQLLARLDRLTVEDEAAPPPKHRPRRKKRRR